MGWNVTTVNLNDYRAYTRRDVEKMIHENRKLHQKYLGEKWNLQGEERAQHESKIRESEMQEMILQLVLEEMDNGAFD